MAHFGIKDKIRFQLGKAGINFNNLKPGWSGTKDTIQRRAEYLMRKHGISVEELKKNSFYEHLENGKNMYGLEIKDGDVVDIDEILKTYREKNKRVYDDAAFDAYLKAWEAVFGDKEEGDKNKAEEEEEKEGDKKKKKKEEEEEEEEGDNKKKVEEEEGDKKKKEKEKAEEEEEEGVKKKKKKYKEEEVQMYGRMKKYKRKRVWTYSYL